MLRRTPLFSAHQKLGARLVEFGGWEMPVQYTGIVEEHLAVRSAAGLFDISHMGEVGISGPAGLAFLNGLLTNDAARLGVGRGQYTLLCNERGGTIDDLYAYRLADQEFLLIINASRIDADLLWLQTQLRAFPARNGVRLVDRSEQTGAVAVQGPAVAGFIDRVFTGPSRAGQPAERPSDLRKNQVGGFDWKGRTASVWVARTGYTGEDGFEIVAPAERIESIWEALLEAGAAAGLTPAGLGARDTLRTEMGFPLYGHELDEKTTPLEAGLGRFVALDKREFVGRAALAAQQSGGVTRRLVAFQTGDQAPPPRPHYRIWSTGSDAVPIGEVTSGTQSPSLRTGIGLGYVPPEFAGANTVLDVEVRGRRVPVTVRPKPLYRKPG
jgi:aminomethyltransferase